MNTFPMFDKWHSQTLDDIMQRKGMYTSKWPFVPAPQKISANGFSVALTVRNTPILHLGGEEPILKCTIILLVLAI